MHNTNDTILLAKYVKKMCILVIKVKEKSEKMELKLYKKKTKLMTTGETTSLELTMESFEVLDNICLLRSTINSKGTSRQDRH